MIDVPRQTLREIVAKYGRSVCENTKRCKALLRDYCPTRRREINVLIGALEERVGEELLAAREGRNATPREVLLSRLTKRLEDNLALTEDAARWAVDSWALALGVLSAAEMEARERKRSESNTRRLETPAAPPPKQRSGGADDPEEERSSAPPPVAQTKRPGAPAAPPVQAPPANTIPVKVAPPSSVPAPAPPQVQPAKSRRARTPAPPADPVPRRRRGGRIRGCLFGCLLLVIVSLFAIFVVPYVVTVLREEQQQQQTIEPPRMP